MSLADIVRRKKGSLLAWGVLGVVVALIALFGSKPKAAEEPARAEEKAVPVRTVEIALRGLEDAIRLPARIEPLQQADLGAERAGRVIELAADKGRTVAEGQLLLRVDGRLWDAARRRAAIEARDAARDLKRWKELEKTGAVSASEYEGVERRQEAAEIALEEAGTMLSQCEVRAPFAGIIVDRMVEVGDYANEGQAVLRLIRLDRVKLAFDVPERDVGALQMGQRKAFTLAAVPGRTFTGEVAFVSSQAARESNSFAVELVVDNADGALKAGMIAQVALVRQMRAGAVVVPLAAIVPHKGEHYVFAAENGRAVRKRVLLGALIGHEAVLDGGLSAGDRIVVEGHRGLQDGMKVEVVAGGGELPAEAAAEAEPLPASEE
ncbi:MAG: efflux RND transporter periplasmic adaptor subunit [Opitutae bacterium]|nr:efflux RND transporter periplasmic adaptor subunit [Opitutae bacterium]